MLKNWFNTPYRNSVSFLVKSIVITLILCSMSGSFYEQEPVVASTGAFSPYTEVIPGTDISIEMVPVPGGTFAMGSPADEAGREEDEGPVHNVKVGSFWIGKYEITWNQYELFVQEEIENLTGRVLPSGADVEIPADAVSLPTPPYLDMSFGMGRDGYPAINMTQYAAVMFAKWLTAKTGHFYRLPTEAEWEYACRAGSETAWHFGDDPQKLGDYAWYAANSDRAYKKTGLKKPNLLGLYDMHGNVAEWTMDQYSEDYYAQFEGKTADNPWLRPETLYPRSVRGGSWMDDPAELRCANRRGSGPRWKMRDPQFPKSLWWLTNASFVGFRLVRPQNPPSNAEMGQYWLEPIEDY